MYYLYKGTELAVVTAASATSKLVKRIRHGKTSGMKEELLSSDCAVVEPQAHAVVLPGGGLAIAQRIKAAGDSCVVMKAVRNRQQVVRPPAEQTM